MINVSRIQLITLIFLGMVLGACQKSEISAQPIPADVSVTSPPTELPTVPASTNTAQPQKKSAQKSGTVIGQPIDCDNDGQDNDFRIDYDGDGIPDDCIIGEDSLLNIENTNFQGSYEENMKSLEKITQGCEEKTQINGNITYSVCTLNGQPVKASEFLTELGDGLSIWFENGQVKAVQRTHNGETFFFDNGKLTVKFEDYGEQRRETVSKEERSEAEELAKTAYQSIFQVFGFR